MQHGALDVSPVGDMAGADHHHIRRYAESAQLATKPDRLLTAIPHLGLDHQEIEIAVAVRITTSVRSKQDYLR